MKLFVTGALGQLGHDVVAAALSRGHAVLACDLPAAPATACGADYLSLDITDAIAVSSAIQAAQPDGVIHCAAWTAVDAAEEEENRATVRAVNAGGTRNLAMACRAYGCKMLYISTDYVFDGSGTAPWPVNAPTDNPLSFYGQTKLEGEEAVRALVQNHFILRIAWVFGLHGNNFVKTMLKLGQKYDSVRVVCDQIGTPTYTPDLARLLLDMIASEKYGTYHATNEGGYISWYDFACAIFRAAGYGTAVQPVTTAEYGLSRAARPKNSRLDKSSLAAAGFVPLPPWQDALHRYLKEFAEWDRSK